MRTKLIRQTILEALKPAQGYALPVDALRMHVDALLRPPLTDEEYKTHIDWLEDKCLIVRIPCEFDDQLVQFAITEKGRVALRTL